MSGEVAVPENEVEGSLPSVVQVEGINPAALEDLQKKSPVGYELFIRLLEVNDSRFEADRIEQFETLCYLNKNFLGLLKKHLFTARKVERTFRLRRVQQDLRSGRIARADKEQALTEAKQYTFTSNETFGILKGEIFEDLVRAEFRRKELSPVLQKPEERTEVFKKLRLAREFMYVWQYPALCGLDKRWRNPDAAFLEIESDGRVIIKSVGEVKSGKLDARAYQQLRATGIYSQIREFIAAIQEKGPEWFDQVNPPDGLPELKKVYKDLVVDEDFKIELFVPRNNDVSETGVTDDQARRLIKTRGNYVVGESQNPIAVDSFVYDLVNSGRIDVKKSLFSTREVEVLTSTLMNELAKEN